MPVKKTYMPVKIWKQQLGFRKIKCPTKFLLHKFQINSQSLATLIRLKY